MAKIKIIDTRTIKILLLREELFAIRFKMDTQPPIQAFLSLLSKMGCFAIFTVDGQEIRGLQQIVFTRYSVVTLNFSKYIRLVSYIYNSRRYKWQSITPSLFKRNKLFRKRRYWRIASLFTSTNFPIWSTRLE